MPQYKYCSIYVVGKAFSHATVRRDKVTEDQHCELQRTDPTTEQIICIRQYWRKDRNSVGLYNCSYRLKERLLLTF
jgi:hypothetical protein